MQFQLIFIFIVYQILQIILLPFFLIYLLVRKLKGKSVFGNFWERKGFVPKVSKTLSSQNKVVWIHAVSVGEILSIQNLIDQIKTKDKNAICYVTTGTPTGKKMAQKNLNADFISFLPFDFLFCMFLAFKRIKPTSIIIIEAEIWPNFLLLSKWFKIPTFLLNARISTRSKNKYHKLKFIFKPLFNIFNLIFTQSEDDKINFKSLGIKAGKLKVLGNIKTLNVLVKKEESIKKNPEEYSFRPEHPTLLVGSVHPGELDVYLNLYKNLKTKFPDLKLILAPRHFHWKQELINKIESLNLKNKTERTQKIKYFMWDENIPATPFALRRSEATSRRVIAKTVFDQNDILLVCKLGELFKLYQLCDIFYLGGTFVPVGGHNLLEPAVWAKPSMIGPHYQNCKDIADQLEKHNALFKTSSEDELLQKTILLLENKTLCNQTGKNAFDWLKNESINVQNNLDFLLQKL